jgi:5-carboxymethyl-2-hydroxymuconate isomerase
MLTPKYERGLMLHQFGIFPRGTIQQRFLIPAQFQVAGKLNWKWTHASIRINFPRHAVVARDVSL